MIFKVQRPIRTNSPDEPWLIYSKGHKNIQQIPGADMPEPIVKAMGEDFKAYFEGMLLRSGRIELTTRVKEQNW